jgi:hypothetical protein
MDLFEQRFVAAAALLVTGAWAVGLPVVAGGLAIGFGAVLLLMAAAGE